MPNHTYTVKLKTGNVKITSAQLESFANMYVGQNDLRKRMSELLWLDIYVLDVEFGVSAHDILGAIGELEVTATLTGTKPPTPFKNLPLKGFWHKHYFSAHFLVQNILLGLGKDGLEKLVNEVFEKSDADHLTKEMIEELAHRIPNEPVEKRDAAKKLTGEWLIYLPHAGNNYYMCCNTHSAGDQFIYDRIMQNCIRDFPDLAQWVQQARSAP